MKVKYKSGYKYQIAETFQYQTDVYPAETLTSPFMELNVDGLLTLFSGYASDGPSGPTFDTKSFMRGAFVHDALYQFIREGADISRKKADEILRQICIEDGMWKVRAWWVYQGVRIGAGRAAHTVKQVMEAP